MRGSLIEQNWPLCSYVSFQIEGAYNIWENFKALGLFLSIAEIEI